MAKYTVTITQPDFGCVARNPGDCKSEVVIPPPALLLTLLCSQYRWAGGLKGSQGLLDPSHSQALSEALSTLHLLELRRRDRLALG